YIELHRISPRSHLIAVLLGKTDGHRRFFSTKDINDEYCKTFQSLFFTDEDEMVVGGEGTHLPLFRSTWHCTVVYR
ncbi:hypothetical protein KUCAC02_014843, partial [Chaenocephalus aceratus]